MKATYIKITTLDTICDRVVLIYTCIIRDYYIILTRGHFSFSGPFTSCGRATLPAPAKTLVSPRQP